MPMHADELAVDAGLVRELLRAQFPSIAELALVPVQPWGTDNAIWRLGEELVVRLPRIGWAAGEPEHDACVPPRLAPALPVPVPEPVALGEPGAGFPYRWSIHRWVPGEGADPDSVADPVRFALDLAAVVRTLVELDPHGAPVASGRARRRPGRRRAGQLVAAVHGRVADRVRPSARDRSGNRAPQSRRRRSAGLRRASVFPGHVSGDRRALVAQAGRARHFRAAGLTTWSV